MANITSELFTILYLKFFISNMKKKENLRKTATLLQSFEKFFEIPSKS